MKKNKNERKEALRVFLDDLFEKKFSDKVKSEEELATLSEYLKEFNELEEEQYEEVCVEPFKLLEPEEMVKENNTDDELTDDELKEFTEMANQIQRVDELKVVKCFMDETDKERLLVDGTNCNIKLVPLLELAMITPVNLSIIDLNITYNMENVTEIKLAMVLEVEENLIAFKTNVGQIGELGLLMLTDVNLPDAELSSSQFRGLTKAVSLDEIESLLK